MPPRPSPPSLELQVFGAPAVAVRGDATRLSLKRAGALLAYLGFHAGPVPRAHLATLLWPDADEALGRTRLRRLVYTVEEALGGGVVVAEGDGLALVAEVDAIRFARFARRAVAATTLDMATLAEARAWLERARRPMLEGIAFGSGVFDDWLKAVSLEHEHLLARLLERVADTLGQQGAFAEALELAEALVALDPYREPSHVLAMQLHARQGDAAGVEAAYTRCAELLRAEFGIRPGPRTELAYLRLTDDLKRLMSNRIERPAVRFAEGGAGAIAYTVVGSGDEVLVVSPASWDTSRSRWSTRRSARPSRRWRNASA